MDNPVNQNSKQNTCSRREARKTVRASHDCFGLDATPERRGQEGQGRLLTIRLERKESWGECPLGTLGVSDRIDMCIQE